MGNDRIIRKTQEKFLIRFRIQTIIASTGKEAMDLFIAGNKFDVVVMNMEMSIMNGPEIINNVFIF